MKRSKTWRAAAAAGTRSNPEPALAAQMLRESNGYVGEDGPGDVGVGDVLGVADDVGLYAEALGDLGHTADGAPFAGEHHRVDPWQHLARS